MALDLVYGRLFLVQRRERYSNYRLHAAALAAPCQERFPDAFLILTERTVSRTILRDS